MKKLLIVEFLFILISLFSVSAQEKVKIALMDFKPGVGVSDSTVDGISEMLISSLFDTRIFVIIERTQINKAIEEQGFQKSNVSAGQIAQVGKILGVKYVLIGIVNFIITERTIEDVSTSMAKGEYNIDVRIVNVESGEVVATAGTGVKGSETIRSVMPGLAKELAAKIQEEQATSSGKIYKIGDFGPAGGLVFYDKGVFSNGWRYLEAAPLETEFKAPWGVYDQELKGTRTIIGSGKVNTNIILEYSSLLGETGTAAILCDKLVFDGYDDWFLPSIDELTCMINRIGTKDGFNKWGYWSSSVKDRYPTKSMSNGYDCNDRDIICFVRAIRAF